ncbi:hypothetical protein DY000_02052239 [Brassica cretica]|uniref:Uncharacterized protein n=1 Tax=Brassica cretica TaxID=69181 RepID=A0ABQ7ACD7_BRACR|nr:hypothetical protein DY000_02052239 [Brassica cretica]
MHSIHAASHLDVSGVLLHVSETCLTPCVHRVLPHMRPYCPRLVQFHGFRSVKVLKFDTPSASPKNCPEAKDDYVRVQISPSRPVSFFMIKPRFSLSLKIVLQQEIELSGSLLPRIGTTKSVVPLASPIEDRGMEIPIEDRDWVIPERLRMCGSRYLKLDSWQKALSNLVTSRLRVEAAISLSDIRIVPNPSRSASGPWCWVGRKVLGCYKWDVGLLEDYVSPVDIPLIRSLAISSTHRRDTFCWNYTRNGRYTIKSGYWVPQNLLKTEEEKEIGHGHPQHSSAGVDEFGWTAWGRFNMWDYEIIYGESLPYIQKWKHCNGRWKVMDIHNTVQQVWMSLDGQLGEGLTCGIMKLYTARVCLTFRSGSTAMGGGNFAKELERIETLQNMLSWLQDHSYSTSEKSDFGLLTRTSRSFNRELCFIGCSIPLYCNTRLPRSREPHFQSGFPRTGVKDTHASTFDISVCPVTGPKNFRCVSFGAIDTSTYGSSKGKGERRGPTQFKRSIPPLSGCIPIEPSALVCSTSGSLDAETREMRSGNNNTTRLPPPLALAHGEERESVGRGRERERERERESE